MRLIRITPAGKVLYKAEKDHCQRYPEPASEDLFGGVARNYQLFEPLDFLAELTQHIPNKGEHFIRYYGCYSIYQADPLPCPNCGGTMKIVAFIEAPQADAIRKILQHCGLWHDPPTRAPPKPSSQSQPARSKPEMYPSFTG